VWRSAKRLAFGFVLIIFTSSILLLSDLDRRKPRADDVSSRAHNSTKKNWKLYLIQYNDVLDVKESEQGVREGLSAAGLQEGRDYTTKLLNAQGDMATVSALIDAAVTGGADMLITFSTPTLQAAIQRGQSLPIVFTYVANGLVAGAGRSETDHLPNVTGVNLAPASEDMMVLIRTWFPGVRRVGTLFVPSEVNMVYQLDEFTRAAQEHGIEVVSLPVSTATEVPDAAAALTSRHIDAIAQIPGNLTASAFGSIAQAAIRARLPVFAFQRQQAADGALIVLARDYKDAGRESAALAARIMRGEDPAQIPLAWFSKTSLVVNLNAARELNIQLPAALVRSANEVLGNADGSHQATAR
jgi:ABC-type uncharacterized transport system substrate-binding protein